MNGDHPIDLRRRALRSRILELIVRDPAFREALCDDPPTALQQAGFAEEIAGLQPTADDVVGYVMAPVELNSLNSSAGLLPF